MCSGELSMLRARPRPHRAWRMRCYAFTSWKDENCDLHWAAAGFKQDTRCCCRALKLVVFLVSGAQASRGAKLPAVQQHATWISTKWQSPQPDVFSLWMACIRSVLICACVHTYTHKTGLTDCDCALCKAEAHMNDPSPTTHRVSQVPHFRTAAV